MAKTSVVQAMIGEFAKHGIVAEWVSTGGGCYAVVINFGDMIKHERTGGFFNPYEIMVTTQFGPFVAGDYDSDDEIPGFWASLYVYGEDWERVNDDGFLLYESDSGLVSALTAREDELAADKEQPDLFAEMHVLVERVSWYAFKVAFAARKGRSAGDPEVVHPEVIRVRRKNGIAGQFQMAADVQYGETTPQPVTFVGSTYGGPVVMVDFNGVQHFVHNPERCGDFGKDPESWVYRFFDQPLSLPRGM